ncbi:class I SAM-dependent methyltransferase [Oerskovia turbata]|uniref:Class I SAM-dependent methyltransferase n=1 Tax=Oerskovia turbata TaxID=1713 RepID=A0A4Q1KQW5_9CELL|nr:class I SAM-dependent methyltransferase [Oerskovia turbata]RXR22376.1 class I SAM-dependent methyltransferase [Oerskovia turbata]RXR32441.1 class I SAM-dependent methyltransferase [Oerskovia turbata]TGJ95874.1 class I SAM-dependent methyltransferase [Actinotalea fermentans ATCC 43279 = JCM 9966 = DSM 3133]
MSTGPALDPEILDFYTDRYREERRLHATAHGRLELLRTRELLDRFLPSPPGRVVDVGGATGVHAAWLAEVGFEVDLIDPVPSHVAQAGEVPGVRAQVGDARTLPFGDASADVVLLLGPLYHLTARADRLLALREAARVGRRGGVVAVAAISRYAGLLELAAVGEVSDVTEPSLRRAIETGVNDPRSGFTTAYFHRPDELAREMAEAGLAEVAVYGVEGPSAPALDNLPLDEAEPLLGSAIRAARLLEQDPALIAASPHFLAFGRVG